MDYDPALHAMRIANYFVQVYYQFLHQAPDRCLEFYHDASILCRPELDGSMTSVTKRKAIGEKIVTMDYSGYKADILSVDAYYCGEGNEINIFIVGWLNGREDFRRKFAQSVLLARQESLNCLSYYVVHDILRYVDNIEVSKTNRVPEIALFTLVEDLGNEPPANPVGPLADLGDEAPANSMGPLEDLGDEPPANLVEPLTEDAALVSSTNQDAPRSSYASVGRESSPKSTLSSHGDGSNGEVVNCSGSSEVAGFVVVVVRCKWQGCGNGEVVNGSEVASVRGGGEVQMARSGMELDLGHDLTFSNADRVAGHKYIHLGWAGPDHKKEASPSRAGYLLSQVREPANPIRVAPALVHGYSIHVGRLPLQVTAEEIEKELGIFGPIMPGGIKIFKDRKGCCYAFVEFKEEKSVTEAVKFYTAQEVEAGDESLSEIDILVLYTS
ncbi:RNA recognition motif domain [Macleaya cordata]|uniref:RNA recognition motif domain n=1 Tax=Macleaya cordata TaxID=56857 RepID=A0A200PRH7_MACCD|nr:RNA recognition motif domain [Macleaya cordata]